MKKGQQVEWVNPKVGKNLWVPFQPEGMFVAEIRTRHVLEEVKLESGDGRPVRGGNVLAGEGDSVVWFVAKLFRSAEGGEINHRP